MSSLLQRIVTLATGGGGGDREEEEPVNLEPVNWNEAIGHASFVIEAIQNERQPTEDRQDESAAGDESLNLEPVNWDEAVGHASFIQNSERQPTEDGQDEQAERPAATAEDKREQATAGDEVTQTETPPAGEGSLEPANTAEGGTGEGSLEPASHAEGGTGECSVEPAKTAEGGTGECSVEPAKTAEGGTGEVSVEPAKTAEGGTGEVSVEPAKTAEGGTGEVSVEPANTAEGGTGEVSVEPAKTAEGGTGEVSVEPAKTAEGGTGECSVEPASHAEGGAAVATNDEAPAAKDDMETQADKSTDASRARDYGREQLLSVQVAVDLPHDHHASTSQTHVVLCVDSSGSMAGKPWTQVQASLKDLISRSIGMTNVKTDLIIYNTKADHVQFTASTYHQIIDNRKAMMATDFKAAFSKVVTVVKDAGPQFTRTIVVFMTDGCDTINQANIMPTLLKNLRGTFDSINKDVCVHAVGFSREHNFEFLKKLAETGGSTPGMFRYCEPGEETVSLQQKLDELFEFILQNTRRPATLRVSMGGEGNFFFSSQQNTAELEGNMEEAEGQQIFTCEAWIHIEDLKILPEFQVFVEMKVMEREVSVVSVPCICSDPELKLIQSADERAAWQLRILTRNVDDLITRVAAAIADKKDVAAFQAKVEKYQAKVARTRVFGSGVTKEGREKVFAAMKEIQANLDRVQRMMAEYQREGTASISLLARAHDMRFHATFSKDRRQRVMDKRVMKNMKYAQQAQDNLSSQTIDEQEVSSLSQEARDFFFCVLSQDSVCDVLLGDDKADTLGFGLAVKRSEVVLDEPTLLRLHTISGTLVSRNAMFDALEYKINISSHLSAHGGFNMQDAPLGVTTVGSGREPINAWLPLYITPTHWNRVKVILKPALGSFITLDPLGYHYKQMDVLFAVLGSMIGQLTERNVGEHQLRLLFAVQRTCAACLEDFDRLNEVRELVANFVALPEGRTKDIIPNLYTLIGYIVSLPTATANEIFCIGEGGSSKVAGFWLAFISELLRRASGNLHTGTSTSVLHGLLYVLLHGQGKQDKSGCVPECQAVSQLTRLCRDPATADLDLNIQPFDPTGEVEVPTLTLKHDPQLDTAMELWAQGQTGYTKNLSRNRKYKQATGAVQRWLKEVSVGLEQANKATEVKCPGKAADQSSKATDQSDKATDQSNQATDQSINVGDQSGRAVEVECASTAPDQTAEGPADTDDDDKKKQEEVTAGNDDDDDGKPDDGPDSLAMAKDWDIVQKEDVDDEATQEGGATDIGKAEEGEDEGAREDTDDVDDVEAQTDNDAFDCQRMTGYMLKVIAQLLNKLCGASFPGDQSLPGCVAFVDNWLSRQHNIADLDTNSGLPPQAWIEEVRQAVAGVYRDLKDLEGSTEGQPDDPANTMVTVVGEVDMTTEQAGRVQQTGLDSKKGIDPVNNANDDVNDDLNDDEDEGNWGSGYDDDEDSDEDGYTAESRRLAERRQRQARRQQQQVLLPTLLRYLARDQDVMVLLRAMLCQAVRFHSNSAARGAITNKVLLDLQDGHEVRVTTLVSSHGFLEEHMDTVRRGMLEKVMWQLANHCMLHATTTWAFVGYLMNIHHSRLEGFSDLVDLFFSSKDGDFTPPCLQDKVHILLTGKYQEIAVLDNGNQWLPEKKMADKFKTLIGVEAWCMFELELRSNVQIHVYRESDIPNRHSHCNSNPYIPNALRQKLGMKMLPEPNSGSRRTKRRR